MCSETSSNGLFKTLGDLRLNPSLAVGQFIGDADLISDGRLLELKTGKSSGFTKRCKVQLLGYLMLCREKRRLSPSFPEVSSIGVYFARHDVLRVFPVEQLVRSENFLATEEWFLRDVPRLLEVA